MHPISLNLFKNILAFLLILLTMPFFGESIFRDVPAGDYVLLFVSGLLGLGIADTLFLKSLNLIGAGLSSIVACLYSPFIITLSIIWLDERLSFLQIFGALMIISAVLTATGQDHSQKQKLSRHNLWWGILLGAVANACTAIGVVIIKPLLARSPLLWVTEMRMATGILVLAVVLLFHKDRKIISIPDMNFRRWIYTIAGSIAGAYLAMILWLAAMKITQASTAAALNQMSNVFIFIFAYLFLKEPITVRRTVGVILGVSGTLLVTFG